MRLEWLMKIVMLQLVRLGNQSHEQIISGKAGRTRWLGRRPKVRGVAMNPVDHPMGGGEGKYLEVGIQVPLGKAYKRV